MTEAFIKAAEEKGHSVTRFDAAMKQVGGCHVCETCFKSGKECALITCCGEQDRSVTDGVRIPIERSASLLK